nr:uncharacterized protein LOC129280914 [Lytechinus pictus]
MDIEGNFSSNGTNLGSYDSWYTSRRYQPHTSDCDGYIYNVLLHIIGITSIIGIIITVITLLTIACHRRVRKKHFIFAFNIVLADLLLNIVIFVDYIVALSYSDWIPLPKVYVTLSRLLFTSSSLVSTTNVLFVAVDQFIAFKLDPFGTRHILTKSRQVCICLTTWVIMIAVSVPLSDIDAYTYKLTQSCVFNSLLTFTGVCYIFVYRSVAETPPGSAGNQYQSRRRKTKRVLKNYALILITNLLLITLPDIIYFAAAPVVYCLQIIWIITQTLNTIANAFIYWWRVREFRAILMC